jgi:transcriptional regulator
MEPAMHASPLFRMADEAALAALVAGRGFAMIAVAGPGAPRIAQAPVLLDGRRLRFHLARSNPVATALLGGAAAVAVIPGADAYISPDWYGIDDQVPTWNYQSVEAEGPVAALDEDDLIRLLDDLSAHFEARLAPKPPWARAKMSPGRFEAMLPAIAGFEMTVQRLEGISKLSQNKPAPAIAQAAAQLAKRSEAGAAEIAGLMAALTQRP